MPIDMSKSDSLVSERGSAVKIKSMKLHQRSFDLQQSVNDQIQISDQAKGEGDD